MSKDNENRNLTGYPHIDKPWMQYYNTDAADIMIPNVNLTEYLKEKNKERESLIAESYYGKKTTFSEFFHNVDLASKALSHIGVKKGDIILNLVPNIPEASRIWLGAIQIGAISDFVDQRTNENDKTADKQKILELIKAEKPKYIVTLEKNYLEFLKPIEKQLIDLGIDTIILLSITDSMNLYGKINYFIDVANHNNLKNQKNTNDSIRKLNAYEAVTEKIQVMQKESENVQKSIPKSPLKIIKYKDLLKESINTDFEIVNDVDAINYIGHTKGTNGSSPKPITATNKNGIFALEQLIKGKVSFNEGDVALNVLPLFAPFGAYNNNLLNLASGVTNVYVPEFEVEDFGYLIKKYRPNIIMGTPAWLASLPSYKKETLNLSCIRRIVYGEDHMLPEDEEILNTWLKRYGSNAIIEKGYIISEFLGCTSYAQKEYNTPGSIGIPLPKTTYSIVDPNNEEELIPLKFEDNQEVLSGELVVSSDAVTPGTLHGDTIVTQYEMDGEKYVRTRDLVHMDKNGIFYLESRKERTFERYDGFKIEPYEIENIIIENENIKYAAITDYFDDKRKGIMPVCHIVLEKGVYNEKIWIELIKELIYDNLIKEQKMLPKQMPSVFKVIERMPLTKDSKIDYKLLREEAFTGDEIIVDIDENKPDLETAMIYINKKGLKLRVKK